MKMQTDWIFSETRYY